MCCSSKYQKAMRKRKNFSSLSNWENFEFVYPWFCDLPFFFLKKQWFFDTLLIFLKNWIINLSWNLDILKLQPISFPTIYNVLEISKTALTIFFIFGTKFLHQNGSELTKPDFQKKFWFGWFLQKTAKNHGFSPFSRKPTFFWIYGYWNLKDIIKAYFHWKNERNR